MSSMWISNRFHVLKQLPWVHFTIAYERMIEMLQNGFRSYTNGRIGTPFSTDHITAKLAFTNYDLIQP